MARLSRFVRSRIAMLHCATCYAIASAVPGRYWPSGSWWLDWIGVPAWTFSVYLNLHPGEDWYWIDCREYGVPRNGETELESR